MDAEDLGEYGIAPQGIKTSAQFKKPNSAEEEARNRKRRRDAENDIIPGQPVAFDELFRPVTDTVGVRLLRNMGWRPGQGIGPRLTKKQKEKQAAANKRMFGCPLPPSQIKDKNAEESSDDEEDELDAKYRAFLFAPDDVPEFVAKPKDNLFGIGYSGLDRSTLSSHINLFEDPQMQKGITMKGAKSNRKIKFSGQAFGVGAYEEDDEDIYNRDDMSRYDFELAEGDGEGGRRKGERKKSRWSEEVAANIAKLIEGFRISKSTSAIRKKFFSTPDLPRGFVPRGGVKKSRFTPDSSEKPLQTTNPTPAQREKVLALPKDDKPAEPKKPTKSDDQIMKLLAASANAPEAIEFGDSFRPFARDPEKQKRYDKFLVCAKNGRSDALFLLQPATMTEWEKEAEGVAFERAAIMFR